jgi:4-amino-4-deoxy-L-arabinose transferase-like glycosyltransferase
VEDLVDLAAQEGSLKTPDAAPAPRRGEAVLAAIVAFALLAAFAWVRDLWDADEGRYAAVALDMKRAGDLVTPRENGMRFLDKPPLVYWGEAAAFTVLGETPFAARLPCLVSGALWCALAFLFAAAWTGSRGVAWLAALLGATCAAGQGFSRLVTMDMPLAAATAGALYAGQRALTDRGWRPRAALGACIGLGLLAKGPLGAVVPALVALSWAVVGAGWKRVLSVLFSPLAWAVALAVAAPWYVLVERANPGYVEHFLVHEHLGRLAKEGTRDFAPVWLYAAALPLFLLPWTHLLWMKRVRPNSSLSEHLGLTRLFEKRTTGSGSWVHRAWAWVVVLLLFFSVGRNRLFTYALPALLPLVVLVAARLDEVLHADERRARRPALYAGAYGLLAVAAGTLLATGKVFEWFPAVRDERWGAMGLPLALAAAPMALAPVLFLLAKTPAARAAVLVGAAAVLAVGGDLARAQADPLRSSRALAHALVAERGPTDEVVCLDVFPQGIRFFEDLYVRIAASRPTRPQREIVEPWASLDGDGVLLSAQQLEALWTGPARVLLVVREEKARPWLDRGGRALRTGLAGGERSDLVLLESRPAGGG